MRIIPNDGKINMLHNPSSRPRRYAVSRKTALATLVALLCHSALQAADDATTLDTLEVWGTEVSSTSGNLDGDALLIKQADHISDLLRTLPGVDVGGAHSLNQRITIRSMDDKDLQITIDGARQNSYMFHHMGNLQIHADILESADIGVGKNSVLDGGLGGTARFTTKSAEQLLRDGARFGGRVQAGARSNAGQSLSLTTFGLIGENTDFLAYYNAVGNDNFEVGGGEIKDAEGAVLAGTDGEVVGLEGDVSDLLLKFGWNINPDSRLSLSVEQYNDEGDYSQRPDMGVATDIAIADNLGIPLTWPTEFSRDTVTARYELDWGGHSFLELTAYHNASELYRDESGYAEANPAWAGEATGEASNTGLSALGESVLGEHTLHYGLEINEYETQYNAVYGGTPESSDESQSDIAVYIQDKIPMGRSWHITPGLRYDSQKLEAKLVDETYDQVSAALAADWQIDDALSLRASATQLFKAPEIAEVFIGAGLNDTANPDIEAETGLNAELSLAWEAAALGADKASAGVTAFQTSLNDYIYDYAANPDPDVRSWKDNVGDMTVDGFELWFGYEKGSLSALLTFDIADSELDAEADYAALDGARLDRVQGDTVSLNIDYAFRDNLDLHWDVQVVGDIDNAVQLDGASEDTAKDGYTVHNVSARWKPRRVEGLALTLGVDNLFDEYYASQSSRTGVSRHPRFGELYLQDYEPGRNVKLTASYDF